MPVKRLKFTNDVANDVVAYLMAGTLDHWTAGKLHPILEPDLTGLNFRVILGMPAITTITDGGYRYLRAWRAMSRGSLRFAIWGLDDALRRPLGKEAEEYCFNTGRVAFAAMQGVRLMPEVETLIRRIHNRRARTLALRTHDELVGLLVWLEGQKEVHFEQYQEAAGPYLKRRQALCIYSRESHVARLIDLFDVRNRVPLPPFSLLEEVRRASAKQ
jgi:hypothetical protein